MNPPTTAQGLTYSDQMRRVFAALLVIAALASACSADSERPTTADTNSASPTPGATDSTEAAGAGPCTPDGPFVPTALQIPGFVQRAPVISVPRDANGIPGVLPLVEATKQEFAFDGPGIQPGGPSGNTLLNTHTWGDGRAMGDRLLKRLKVGDPMILFDAQDNPACYRVTRRREVPFDFNATKIYRSSGKPQIVIVVCSGERLKPGEWTHRTLWFAEPEQQPA